VFVVLVLINSPLLGLSPGHFLGRAGMARDEPLALPGRQVGWSAAIARDEPLALPRRVHRALERTLSRVTKHYVVSAHMDTSPFCIFCVSLLAVKKVSGREFVGLVWV
jgi:hypothetical protein